MCINFFYNCEVVNRIQVFLRSTVQMLLAILDSDGVARRKARRMKRLVYQNKVGNVQRVACHHYKC